MSLYIAESQVLASMGELGRVHPFLGITFLACKKAQLPVGRTTQIHLDGLTRAHMDAHHKVAPESSHYYQPFNPTHPWVKAGYPSSGLQAINTQTCAAAFLHIPRTREWGWSEQYLDVLESLLKGGDRVPAFDLAVWLYRGADITDCTSGGDLVALFLDEYCVTAAERERLFDLGTVRGQVVTRDEPVGWPDLRASIAPPPDAKPEGGGALGLLELFETGPAKRLTVEPAERMTLITGDNGLGKTFLLECAWWALSGSWAGRPALPRDDAGMEQGRIRFSIRGDQSKVEPMEIRYDWRSQNWPSPVHRPTIAGLVVYAAVDGSFAVWDPAKSQEGVSPESVRSMFSSTEVWDGRPGAIEGIVRDWGRWQRESDSWQFETFVEILRTLSPPDLGPMCPGRLKRIPNDLRDIPTIRHAYGETPILFASAGIKRVLALTYLMVWAWQEHRVSSDLSKRAPESRMVILVDEVEAHLHPQWQRQLLPAVLDAVGILAADLSVQLIVTTHSPLVLASTEPIFDEGQDALLHLHLGDDEVSLDRMPFVKYGEASRWLTSPVFDMRHARSRQAEDAIEVAKKLQLAGRLAVPEDVHVATARLREHLAGDDPFWPRWIGFAEGFGINV